VTATTLFDGHDASINIIRRILQQTGAEVIHLGHNRAALDVVTAAIQEDAQAIAVSQAPLDALAALIAIQSPKATFPVAIVTIDDADSITRPEG